MGKIHGLSKWGGTEVAFGQHTMPSRVRIWLLKLVVRCYLRLSFVAWHFLPQRPTSFLSPAQVSWNFGSDPRCHLASNFDLWAREVCLKSKDTLDPNTSGVVLVPKTYLNSPLGPFYPKKLRFNLSAISTLSGSLPVPIKTVETAAVEGKMELKSRLLPIYGHANCGIHSRWQNVYII